MDDNISVSDKDKSNLSEVLFLSLRFLNDSSPTTIPAGCFPIALGTPLIFSAVINHSGKLCVRSLNLFPTSGSFLNVSNSSSVILDKEGYSKLSIFLVIVFTESYGISKLHATSFKADFSCNAT